jgi:hypothetical protein
LRRVDKLLNVTKRNVALKVKGLAAAKVVPRAGITADRKLLYRRASAVIAVGSFTTGRARSLMWLSSTPSFAACPNHGGVGGASRNDRPSWQSMRFAPMPRGTDTAGPADRF